MEIKPAKEISGTCAVPPNPDLLALSCHAALAANRAIHVGPVPDAPIAARLKESLAGVLDITGDADGWRVAPKLGDGTTLVSLLDRDLRFRELIVFLLLGAGKSLHIDPLPDAVLGMWQATAGKLNCIIEKKQLDDGFTVISLSSESVFSVPEGPLPHELMHPCLGLAFGLKQPVVFDIDYQFSSPLRHLVPALGYELSVRSNTGHKENELLAKRLRFLGPRRKSDQGLSFTVSADFSRSPGEPSRVTLPGDDILGALLLETKALVQKGNLIIENLPLEIWSNATLNLLRKMGCRPAVQESGESSFGKTGMVQLQRFELLGRKTECSPYYLFGGHVPAMVVVSCFAKGQSVLRGLGELRGNEPDGIEQILECVRAIGGRHGEMPDGIVVDGLKQFDGFDLATPLPASLSGACAVAGLKCMGTTTVADETLLERWPGFTSMLDRICEYRK